MAQGIDYAWSKPRPGVLRGHGYTFVCRYLSPPPNGKNLTAPERAALHAAGVDVVLNWEFTQFDMKGGFAKGVSCAKQALGQATALGAPTTAAIYFSADWDVQPGELATVQAFLDGAASVIGRARVGIYGGYAAVHAMRQRGAATWGWQTYAWSHGAWSPLAHLRQVRNGVTVDGADCDVNENQTAAFGQWAATPTPVPGDDMSQQQVDHIEQMLIALINGMPVNDGAPNAVAGGITALLTCTDLPGVANVRNLTTNQLAAKVTAIGVPPSAMTIAVAVAAMVKAQSLTLGADQLGALTTAVSQAVADHPDTPLGDADKPAIEAALRDVLNKGIATST